MPADSQETKSTLVVSYAEQGRVAKLAIEGDINMDYWDLNYQEVKWMLEREKDKDIIETTIFSQGGSVTDGVGMYRLLVDAPNTVHTYVNAYAGSIATVIQMAGDKMFVSDNATIMIHSPLNMIIANAEGMRKEADILDTFEAGMIAAYMRHFKGSEEELKDLLKEETYMTADIFADKFNDVTILSSGGAEAIAHKDPVAYMGSLELPEDNKQSLGKRIFNKALALGKDKPKPQEEADMPMSKEEMEKVASAASAATIKALQDAGALPVATAPTPAVTPAVTPAPEAVADEPVVDVPFVGKKDNEADCKAHMNKVIIAQSVARTNFGKAESIAAHNALIASMGTQAVPQSNQSPAPLALGTAPLATDGIDESFIDAQVKRMNGVI